MIRLGTRGSLLARTQSGLVAAELSAAACEPVELVVIRTDGDDTSRPLDAPGRQGAFVSALRDALLAGEVDVVVHSYKDLPSAPADGLVVAAIPPRASAADVIVGPEGGLSALACGSRVGTSSPRRAASLRRFRPDLDVVAVRGNVDTRIAKARSGEVDAVVLAAAGLERVERLDEAAEILDIETFLPAPAQGALAVECRTDSRLVEVISGLDDPSTRLAVSAERAVLAGVRAACTTAVGAHADIADEVVRVVAELTDHAGVDHARTIAAGPATDPTRAAALGLVVAQRMLRQGGSAPVPGPESSPLPAGHPLHGPTAASSLVLAYRGHRTARRPVWFMRQAGRSLPEYRQVRRGIGMLEACLRPDLVAEITCQPVRRHDVDAGILFSDIMVPLRLAGVGVDIVAGIGPVMTSPVRTAADVDSLPELDPQSLEVISEAVRLSVAELGATPLIGFCGAPFTIASYLVEGRPSRDYLHTRALMTGDAGLWEALLSWVARTTRAFLRAQVLAGASAVQLFDSWIGALSPAEYTERVQAHSAAVLGGVGDLGVPRVHFGTRSAPHLLAMRAAGADVIGVAADTSLTAANDLFGGTTPLQGNLDPALLSGDWAALEAALRETLADGSPAPGHVVNLGHGVPPTTDPRVLTDLVSLVHSIPDQESKP